LDNESHNGSFSQVSSTEVKPVGAQSIQSVQFVQDVHDGVQGGGCIQFVGVDVGVGVGVGVGSIIVEHSCV
jgi:hypothetical protein